MRLHTTIHVSKISHGQHNNKIGSAESRQFKVTWQKKLNLKILLSRDNNWQEWKSDLQRINKYFQLLQLNSVTAAGNQSDTQCANDEWEGLDRTYRWRFVCVLLLQSCPTLCDSMDCSPSGSSVHGFLQARITGVGCRFLFQGIFPTQGLNSYLLSLLRWQVSSLPLAPPGKSHRL